MLQRLSSQYPGATWDSFIPDIMSGLNHSINTVHGYKPIELLLKQPVIHPTCTIAYPYQESALEETEVD